MDAREGGSLSNAELLDELNVSEREGEGGTERKNTGEYVLEAGGLSLRTSFRLRLVDASLASRGRVLEAIAAAVLAGAQESKARLGESAMGGELHFESWYSTSFACGVVGSLPYLFSAYRASPMARTRDVLTPVVPRCSALVSDIRCCPPHTLRTFVAAPSRLPCP